MKLLPSSVIVISLLSISILTSCDAILDKRKPIDLVCTGVGSDGNPFKKTLTFKPTKRLGTALGALDTDDTDDWSLTFDGDSTYLPVSFKYGDDNKIYELQSVHTVITEDKIRWTNFEGTKEYWSDSSYGEKILMPKTETAHYITINRISGDFEDERYVDVAGVNKKLTRNKERSRFFYGKCVPAKRF